MLTLSRSQLDNHNYKNIGGLLLCKQIFGADILLI